MAAWILYATCVSLLLGAAAWILERALQQRAFPLRLIWAVALATTASVPVLTASRSVVIDTEPSAARHALAPPLTSAATDPISPTSSPVEAAPPQAPRWTTFAAWPSLPRSLDPWVLRFWLLLSLATAAVLLRAFVSLRLARRRWERSRIEGRDVLVSQAVGPAVVGAFRTAIVVPRWVTALSRAERELVLRHEEEHIRAGDLRLLIAALLLAVLFPWNAGLWWQIKRLRMAVELDCDRRVVRHGDLRRYAGLLLDLGQRGAALRLGALALTHSTPLLERRIRIMTTSARPRRALAASLTAVASIFALAAWRLAPPVVGSSVLESQALVAVAVDSRPDAIAEDSRPDAVAEAARAAGSAVRPLPTAGPPLAAPIPATDPVGGANADAPPAQGTVNGRVTDRSSGAPLGSVQVYLAGDDMGTITRATGAYSITDVPPGVYEIRAERIGLTLGRQEITVVEGSAIEVNFELGAQAIGLAEIRSDGSDGAGPVSPPAPARMTASPRRPEGTPSFTPFVVRPAVLNVTEVQQVMANEYTSGRLPAGLQASFEVWLYVAADGTVGNIKINRIDLPDVPTSVASLLGAPRTAAEAMRFSPAMNRDEAVAAWVAVPLTFTR